ncbi:monalysin family beta-barrel pore-forming toxin [Pseudomonas sp. SWRI100]|uniref:monalysin family beta-barrel pore-forming toxin n=1 Tax=Pseudomonas TaxID=286 RepID=UPI001645281D|nr:MULTISPECIES: monalysin family beta-barrel pore-forming toxin [Pseudomonas]MBC3497510.1 monalysin family beta-barrel pore-forming toxin [Pseudomonas sp. SWRI67]MBV4525115.1 monalysin family beta-barrel pore-forming toxin [Pseudomonas kermanshahensis]
MSDYASVRFNGSYEIERSLYSLSVGESGVFVGGDTVLGAIHVHGKTLECFTRPVYAYLAHCEMVQGTVSGGSVHRQPYQCGFSSWFYSEVVGGFKVSPGIDRVNALSGIVCGVSPRKLWAKPSTCFKDIPLSGAGHFSIYQMHMVYAHCAVGKSLKKIQGSQALSEAFHSVDSQRIMLSSLGFDRLLAVGLEDSVEPESWSAVKKKLLQESAFDMTSFADVGQIEKFNRYI